MDFNTGYQRRGSRLDPALDSVYTGSRRNSEIPMNQGCAMGWDNYGIGRGMVPFHEIGWDGFFKNFIPSTVPFI